MFSILPLEIEEMILDLLSEDDEVYSASKTCSLVCKAFLHICRKHIFRSIVLNKVNGRKTRSFEQLLRETPEIADYIRKLDYIIRIKDLTSPTIRESFKRISRLEFLTVNAPSSSGPRHYWSNSPIRPALLHLLHLPTLTHFKVINMNDFVVSDLIPASTSSTWISALIRLLQLKILSLQLCLNIQSNRMNS